MAPKKTHSRVARTHQTTEFALRFDRSTRAARASIRAKRRDCSTMGVSEVKGRRWPVLKNPAPSFAGLPYDDPALNHINDHPRPYSETPAYGTLIPLGVELDMLGDDDTEDLDPESAADAATIRAFAAAGGKAAPFTRWRNIAANDVAYSWDTSVWKVIATDVSVIRRSWWLGKARHDDAFGLPMAVLQNRATGHRLAGAMLHMPASVNNAYRMVRGVPVPLTARAVGHLWFAHEARRRLRAFARKHQADAVQLCADVNLSWHDDWVPKWFRSIYRHWQCCWEVDTPAGGSHRGGRLIDWIWMLGATFLQARVLRYEADVSDHCAITSMWRFNALTPLHVRKPKKK